MRKPLKYDNFKRGDRVIAYDKENKKENWKGEIVRICNSKDRIFVHRDDHRYSYGAPRINGQRTWRCYQRDDGTWNANSSLYSMDDTLYFDRIEDWQYAMKECQDE